MLVTNEIFINSVLSTANKSAKQILQQESSLQTPNHKDQLEGVRKETGKTGTQFGLFPRVLPQDIMERAPLFKE